MWRGYVHALLEIGRDKGIELVTNDITWDGGEHQTTIGIPTKKQLKRKIWRGLFWVRYDANALNFWLPDHVDLGRLSEEIGLKIQLAPVTHNTGGKSKSVLVMVKLSELDLGNPKHRTFIANVIDQGRPSRAGMA
jgi:hypothetical protein